MSSASIALCISVLPNKLNKVNANDNKLYFHYLADLVIADTPEGLREKLSENDFAQVHLQGESLEIINKYFES